MNQSIINKAALITIILTYNLGALRAQTFFDTAKDDGIITFSKDKTSQIKLNLSTSATTFGYNYIGGNAIHKERFIISTTIKAKPNDDGTSTLLKTGSLQPGLMINSAIGVRLIDKLGLPFFSAIDISIKPAYQLNGFTIYDSLQGTNGTDPVYKTNRGSFALNGLINGVLSPGTINIFFGIQYGANWTNNGDDLSKGTIQTVSPYAGNATKSLFTNVQDVKYGQLIDRTKYPLKIDLIFDPGLKLGGAGVSNINLAFFGYYRTDGFEKKYRKGFGICFLNAQNPSKVFSALGYEMPTTGPDVKVIERQKDKGSIFFTVGYSIL